jgi:hypothetical protein
MPRISDLPQIVAPDGADEIAIVDDSTPETKKISLLQIKDWLASLVSWITTAMLADNAVTSDKADLSYVHVDGTGLASSVEFTTITPTDTGYSITLPTAGTWLITCKIRTRLDTSVAGRYIRLSLRQNDTTEIAESICNYDADNTSHTIHNQPMIAVVITTSTNETVDVWGAVNNDSSVTEASVESDTNGYSTMTAVRIK